mmetsp:Transcript_165/g.262  ORF Transcript_165/g.262 Transcript_165/m.262 type:complete len:122 (-) Transcript_165:57-422(-)
MFEEHRSRKTSRETYLGLLSLVGGLAVFGSVSNTLVKTIVVVDVAPQFTMPDDVTIDAFLKRLYLAYVRTTCNPFVNLGSTLSTLPSGDPACTENKAQPEFVASFQKQVKSLVESTKLLTA